MAIVRTDDNGILINAYKWLFGLEPERVTDTTLKLYRGSVAHSNSGVIYSTNSETPIDMEIVGAGGRDAGVLANGQGYHIYVIVNDETQELSAVASTSIIYGDVVVPAGYSMVRKLPFGFVYNTIRGGVPGYHLSGWPAPFVRYTLAESTAPWRALTAGTATDFEAIDFTGFMPDNARMVQVMTRVHAGTTAGSAYIRSTGAQATGLLVGQATNNAVGAFNTFDIRVTSQRQLEYKVAGGVSLSIYVLGYYMTEKS